MKQHRELYEALRNVLDTGDDVFAATVTSVDKQAFTCDVDTDGLERGGIRLQAIVKEGIKGVCVFPAVGSVVLVKRIDNQQFFVCMYSDVEEVVLQNEGYVYKLNNQGHLIANGDDTLKQALTLLIEAVQQVVVLYGNNPDYIKLQQAMIKVNNIFQ